MSAAGWLERRVEGGSLSWGELSRMVQFAQGELGVEADGKWGAKSAAALLERVGPPPAIGCKAHLWFVLLGVGAKPQRPQG